MAILSIPQQHRCLDAGEFVSIAYHTCSRDELGSYFVRIGECKLCACIIDRLLERSFFAPAPVSLEATA